MRARSRLRLLPLGVIAVVSDRRAFDISKPSLMPPPIPNFPLIIPPDPSNDFDLFSIDLIPSSFFDSPRCIAPLKCPAFSLYFLANGSLWLFDSYPIRNLNNSLDPFRSPFLSPFPFGSKAMPPPCFPWIPLWPFIHKNLFCLVDSGPPRCL